MPNLVMFTMAGCFFQTILMMRPADEHYREVHEIYKTQIYTPDVKALFRDTHVQHPHEHLEMRKSFAMEKRPSLFANLRNSITSISTSRSSSTASRRMSTTKSQAVRRLSDYRAKLYDASFEELSEAGMTKEEIAVSGFDKSDPKTFGRVSVVNIHVQIKEEEEEWWPADSFNT